MALYSQSSRDGSSGNATIPSSADDVDPYRPELENAAPDGVWNGEVESQSSRAGMGEGGVSEGLMGAFQYPQAPVCVGVQHWVALARDMSISTGDYVKAAVKLSFVLVKHLMQRIGAGDISLLDIVVENVAIFVKAQAARQPAARSLAVHAVQLQPGEPPNNMLMMPPIAQSEDYSRSVCGALGNILLEIFSKGQSSLPGVGISQPRTGLNENNTLSYSTVPHAAQRRNYSVPQNDSISTRVNILLLEGGMPMSIRHLVCDLLDATSIPYLQSAPASLDKVFWDLSKMIEAPEHSLFDRTCPQKALDFACQYLYHSNDRHLFGREKELDILMNAKKNVANHIHNANGNDPIFGNTGLTLSGQDDDFYCEGVILSGYAGSGKSSLLQSLICTCDEDNWFVLSFKFEQRDTSQSEKVLAKTLNDFFGTWASNKNALQSNHDPPMMDSFQQVCHSIASTLDNEGLCQLCEIVPNLRKVSPLIATKSQNLDQTPASADQVGSANKRRMILFHVVFKSLCSVGRPVLLAYDDMQWANSLEGLKQFIANYNTIPCVAQKERRCRHGCMFVGTFRSNEVSDEVIETIKSIEQNKNAEVTRLTIEGLAEKEISELLSTVLCLPLGYTGELAGIVHKKTRGNCFFVIQFIRSIIQNKILSFSVEYRQWKWDCDVVEMTMISDGVAELLTSSFRQLPSALMDTLKVVSCLGYQVEKSTLDALNSGNEVLPFNMQTQLELAVQEGIMEKAGPIFQFSHDLVLHTIYYLLPTGICKLLHKIIGIKLLKCSPVNDLVHLIAVDQINTYCTDSHLSREDRSHFAICNAKAANIAIEKTNFGSARTYIDAGIQLLDTNRWVQQYSLTLNLYNMSASVSCFSGDIGALPQCLQEIIANVDTFEDSLTASSLLLKLLGASSKYGEALMNGLTVLSTLGEEFPQDIDLPTVLNEFAVIQTTLKTITVEQVEQLPAMIDKTKLNAMKFLSMICRYSIHFKPMLLPLISCRMVRITMEHGFCDDSIFGLIMAGWTLFTFTDEMHVGHQISKVGEALIQKQPQKNTLLSQSSRYIISFKVTVEPAQSIFPYISNAINAGMLAGDIESAMVNHAIYCIASLYIGMPLVGMPQLFIKCIQQMEKYKQLAQLYGLMSALRVYVTLTDDSIGIEAAETKSFEELNQIGRATQNGYILYHLFMSKMSSHFWSREFIEVCEISEIFRSQPIRRDLDCYRVFFEGLASLCLTRQTHLTKWITMGEEAIKKTKKLENISKWNYESKSNLLQAEHHYTNGQLDLAEIAYKASITSANVHRFINDEALAYEMYGIFCIENCMVAKGFKQLNIALDKYIEWGATKKAEDLQLFIALNKTAFKGPWALPPHVTQSRGQY